MNISEKLDYVIGWYQDKYPKKKFGKLSETIDNKSLKEIESLISETLPQDFISIYSKYNGETDYGSFLGETIMSGENIASNVKYSLIYIKPENPCIPDPIKAKNLLDIIVANVIEAIPIYEKDNWDKIFFNGDGSGGLEGPYLYEKDRKNDENYEILDYMEEEESKIFELIKELHALEYESYNWDELHFEIYSPTEYIVKREYYDLVINPETKVFPEKAIKNKYFHFKWIPIITDGGGNFIGIDLDPDIQGKKGQVIVFGRDENLLFVISDSFNGFLDYLIKLINENPEKLIELGKTHLHDILKHIIVPPDKIPQYP